MPVIDLFFDIEVYKVSIVRCVRTVQTIRAVSVGHIVTKVTNQLFFLKVVSNAVNASLLEFIA